MCSSNSLAVANMLYNRIFSAFPLLVDRDKFPIFQGYLGEITEAGSLELAKGDQRRAPRMRASSYVRGYASEKVGGQYAVRVGGVKIDTTIRAAPRNTGVFRKKAS
jgi:hypothetical protein